MKTAAAATKSHAPANPAVAVSTVRVHETEHRHAEPAPVSSAVSDVLRAPGQPLDSATAGFMAERFGRDFSTVRVHAGPQAAESARAVGASAYTFGRDIVFASGRYAPQTRSGRQLLAHELAHVVQQGPQPLPSRLRIDDRAAPEQAADRAAAVALNGGHMPMLQPSRGIAGLQRQRADKAEQGDGETKPVAALPGIEDAVDRDPDSLLRMDTFTVIELGGGDWCRGCMLMRHDLSDLAGQMKQASSPVAFKVYSINTDGDKNQGPADKLRAISHIKTIPQTFVYAEHKLLKIFDGYDESRDYIAEFKALHKSASSHGVFKGMAIGAGVGAAAGGIAGAIIGGVIGGHSGNAAAGIALGGLLGGGAGAALGLGTGALIGATNNSDIGAARLSEERKRQVREYLFGTPGADGHPQGGVHGNRRIVGGADDLARDAVELWIADPQGFALDVDDRRLLVAEMQTSSLGRADQRGILKILENSANADLLRLFNDVGKLNADERREKVSMADLQSRFGGEERKMLDGMLERLSGNFPVAPKDQPKQGHWIDRPEVRSRMKSAYERTRRFTAYGEIAGAFFRLNDGGLGYYEKEFPGTTSHMDQVVREARESTYKNYEPVEASFHTHPTIAKGDVGRSAPSSADLTSAKFNPMMGEEHYVIDTWVVHLIKSDGSLIEFGRVESLLGVTPPPVPPGQKSTLETR